MSTLMHLVAATGARDSPAPSGDDAPIRIGVVSETGRREDNQDFAGASMGTPAQRALRGTVAALADGVGGARGGRAAAESAVRGFIEGYYQAAETLSVERAAARALAAVNRWVHAQSQHDPLLTGMATTFSALLLRGRSAHVVHVGDTRIYRLREARLTRLTEDHTLSHPDLTHVLYRAVGIESELRIDYAAHSLCAYDRYLLCSDGVHAVLEDRALQKLLSIRAAPELDAQRIVDAALAAGSRDNVTAIIVDVLELPEAAADELAAVIESLPLRPLPEIGVIIDDYEVQSVLADGRYSRLYLAHDQREQRPVVLKFPQARVANDAASHQAFVREAWIAARVHSPWLGTVLECAPGRRSALYSVMPHYAGETLEKRLSRRPRMDLKEGIEIGIRLAKAAYALHRAEVIHRDIKPDNVLLETQQGLKLLDLGAARLLAWDQVGMQSTPGTPSYMAPELFSGAPGDIASDVYALGVTLYRMFSGGHYPYGEVEPFSTPRFQRRTALTQHRPDLPAWLDRVLAKACAVNPRERYADAMELAFELENGLAQGSGSVTRKVPLIERNPVRFWQGVSALLAIALLVAVLH